MQTYDALRKAMFDSGVLPSTPSRAPTPTPRRPPGDKVSDLISTYPIALKSLDYQSVTSRLRGFLHDVRKVEAEELANNAFVSAAMLKSLEDANEAFDKAFLDRNTERQQLKQTDITALLANLTAVMKLICAMIEVKANEEVTERTLPMWLLPRRPWATSTRTSTTTTRTT